MENNLIFIEGVSGVGKTTAVTNLCDKLHDMGHTVACHLEGDYENPLDPFKGTYPPPMPIATFTQAYLNCWRAFVEGKYANPLILDGTLLHHQINDLIRNYNASSDAIIEHLTILIEVIQPLKPILFYLSSDDVGQRLTHARESRNESAPTKEQFVFWEDRKCVDLYALNRLPVKSYILNVDSGWNTIPESMAKYITLK